MNMCVWNNAPEATDEVHLTPGSVVHLCVHTKYNMIWYNDTNRYGYAGMYVAASYTVAGHRRG